MGTFLLAGLIAASTAAPASADTRRESLRAAAARIARTVPVEAATRQSRTSDWKRVTDLQGSRVRVTLRSGLVKEGRLGAADNDRIVVMPDAGSQLPIARQDIAEVRRPMRGSTIGAVIGTAAGAVAGVASAFHFAFKQCGESCQEESTLLWGSLIGLPIAGGYAGAYLGARGRWVVVYRG